jgi:DNA-directed RNA polymerase I subunit RPA1
VKGDIVGAKRLDSDTSSETSYPDDIDVSQYNDKEHLCNQGWTSLQFTEAMSALRKLLKPRSGVCKNCEARNPKISKPTFGWFYMVSFFMSLQLENCPCDQQ